MKSVASLILFVACRYSQAQEIDIGRAEPPYVEAKVAMPTKFMQNAEKRRAMVDDLAGKSQMNYRLLGMKIMEQWQASIKKDKTFLHEMMQHPSVAFTVKKDGTILIEGVDAPVGKDGKGGDANAKKNFGKQR